MINLNKKNRGSLLLFFMLFSTTLIFNCSSENSAYKVYSINELMKSKDSLLLEDADVNIKLIPLDNRPEATIGELGFSIIEKDDYYYISSGTRAGKQNILKFDSEGKFVKQISAQGRAGNEFILVQEIYIDGDHLYLVDLHSQKTLKFTADGDFVEKIAIKGRDVDQRFIGKNGEVFKSIVATMGNSQFKFLVENAKGDTIMSMPNGYLFKPDFAKMSYIIPKRPILSYGDDIIYNQFLSDTIYTINKTDYSAKIRYVIDNPYPTSSENYLTTYKRDMYCLIDGLNEDKNYIYMTLNMKGDRRVLNFMIDKRSGKYYKTDFTVKMPDGKLIYPNIVTQQDDKIICITTLNSDGDQGLVIIEPK